MDGARSCGMFYRDSRATGGLSLRLEAAGLSWSPGTMARWHDGHDWDDWHDWHDWHDCRVYLYGPSSAEAWGLHSRAAILGIDLRRRRESGGSANDT